MLLLGSSGGVASGLAGQGGTSALPPASATRSGSNASHATTQRRARMLQQLQQQHQLQQWQPGSRAVVQAAGSGNGNGFAPDTSSSSSKQAPSWRSSPREMSSSGSIDWGTSAFPSYLVSFTGRPFPCQEGVDPNTVRAGSKMKWKREDAIWQQIRQEAAADAASEPLLSSFLYASILAHDSFEKALAFVLANRLADTTLLPTQLFEIFVDVLSMDDDMRCGALADVEAGMERDPACISMVQAILNCKGFQAIQTHRVAHSLWKQGKRVMALALQSRASEVFAVDIHPGARIGKGILLDHGTGVVIGETAVVGDNCSMLQNVTLGGTGKETGDRHPKIGNNVLIGASATVLGNITIGDGSMIGAGSLVLKPVDARTMVAGSPAKEVGKVAGVPAFTMQQQWDHPSSSSTQPSPTASLASPQPHGPPAARPKGSSSSTISGSLGSSSSGSSNGGGATGTSGGSSSSSSSPSTSDPARSKVPVYAAGAICTPCSDFGDGINGPAMLPPHWRDREVAGSSSSGSGSSDGSGGSGGSGGPTATPAGAPAPSGAAAGGGGGGDGGGGQQEEPNVALARQQEAELEQGARDLLERQRRPKAPTEWRAVESGGEGI